MTSSKTFRKFLLASAVSAVMVFGAGPSYSEEQTAQKVMNLRDAVAVGLATNPEYGVVAASKRTKARSRASSSTNSADLARFAQR